MFFTILIFNEIAKQNKFPIINKRFFVEFFYLKVKQKYKKKL